MKSQRQAGSPRILLVVVTFTLMCAVILLASLEATAGSATGPAVIDNEHDTGCSSESARMALEDAALADLALREKNFGAAQLHIQRARVRLEATASSRTRASVPYAAPSR